MSSIPTLESRFLGGIFGLAVGDALGTTLEFSRPGTFTPITDLVGGGPFKLPPGNWTDDTSMAICMALSLIEKGEWNPSDCMDRFVRWYNEGYMSGKNRCFDIGNTTAGALAKFTKTMHPYCGGTDKNCSGNGSIMRLCPVPLLFHKYPTAAIEIAADSSRLTHGSEIAKDCCRYMSGLIVGALHGNSKEELLSVRFSPEPNQFNTKKLCPFAVFGVTVILVCRISFATYRVIKI
ncbi:ADP-ribosylation/Crystallin J1 [Paraphysoderma sedebokerense]|nr:ADP-ribosylation/Crystallin J1 [Paraphysoderma sedebokerense]